MIGAGEKIARASWREDERRRRCGLLAGAIKGWRIAEDLSERQAAGRLALSPGWLRDAELRRIDPNDLPPSTVVALIGATGLSAEEIGLEQDPAAAVSTPDPAPAAPRADAGGGRAGAAAPGGERPGAAKARLASGEAAPVVSLGAHATVLLSAGRGCAFARLTGAEAEELGHRLIAHAKLAAA